MDTMKVNLAAMNEKLNGIGESLVRNETNVKAVVENMVEKFELVEQKLDKEEKCSRRLEEDNVEIRKSLNVIMKQLEKMTQTSHEVQAEEMKKGIAEGGGMDRESKVVMIAGGSNLNSVEMFSLATGT